MLASPTAPHKNLKRRCSGHHRCIDLLHPASWLICCTLLLFGPSALSEKTLIIGWEHYPPQQVINSQGKLTGVDIEIARAVLVKAGFDIKFKKTPWQRLLNFELKNGSIDVALNAALKKERKHFIYYSDKPYLPSQSALYILPKNQARFKGINQLEDFIGKDLIIGVTRGLFYSPNYSKLLSNTAFTKNLFPSNKEEQNIRMLLAERVDGILMERYIFEELLKEIASPKKILRYSELDFNADEAGSFFMFSKASMQYNQIQRINKALHELKSDGTIETLIQRHLYQRADSPYSDTVTN